MFATILFRVCILLIAGGFPIAVCLIFTWLIGPALTSMDNWEEY